MHSGGTEEHGFRPATTNALMTNWYLQGVGTKFPKRLQTDVSTLADG